MNLLYVAPDIPVPHTGDFIGGTTHTLEIAKRLAELGNTVYIISRRMQGQRFFEKISEQVYTYRIYRGVIFPVKCGVTKKSEPNTKIKIIENLYFSTVYRIFLMAAILTVARKHHINIVLERNSAKGAGVFSGRLLGIPSVVEVIDPDYNKLALRLCRKIFAYTTTILPPDVHSKTEITHAGVDAAVFRPMDGSEVRTEYNLTGSVVVYVGSMSAWHGAEHLIDVAARIKDMDVTFLMVGKDVEMLRSLAEEKGVLDRFVFTGFVPYADVPKYIAAADVAVAPYDPAGVTDMEAHGFYFSPIKIFEYMACGKPVVASDVEIVRGIIRESRCGLLADPGGAGDFAEKIQYLIEDDDLMAESGKNGRAAVLERYSWKKVAEQIHMGLLSTGELFD